MTQKARLTGSGLPGQTANYIVGDASSGQTATGTTQTDAYLLNDVTEFTTVASGSGAKLPPGASGGDNITIYNGGANALLVYPALGESINALSANASLSVATNKSIMFVKTSATRWVSLLTA